MKRIIFVLALIASLIMACEDNQKKGEVTTSDQEIGIEGMWQLKTGIWDNEDGTYLTYPNDSLFDGPAYIIYSKSHYMTIAKASKMDYFRGELIEYNVDGDQLILKTKVSNYDAHEGMEATWTFKLDGNLLTTELGKNKEVWERVE